MSETPDSLLSLINASGFLFQLRVEEEVRKTQSEHNWKVEAREHRWAITDLGEEGYIDTILTSGNLRMIIECKRVREASWVFLIPDKKMANVQRAKLCWWDRTPEHSDLFGYTDFNVLPYSPESAFCVVRGQSDKDKPMLERLSTNLLRSLECFASEELDLTISEYSKQKIYIPIIVTTASLEVFYFNPEEVDIQTGEFLSDQLYDGQFQSTPFIRFRKSLTTTLSSTQNSRKSQTIAEVNRENERTIFVINATELSNILKQWRTGAWQYEWPWTAARKTERWE